MRANIKILPLGEYAANCTVAWNDPQAAWIFDPGGDEDVLLGFLKKNSLVPALVALTHAHFDHIGAIPALLGAYPQLPIHVGPGDVPYFGHPFNANPPSYPSVPRPATLVADLTDGATLSGGGLSAHVISTPGHTPGGCCIHFRDDSLLIAGDTLFAGSVGRTDLPGGDSRALQESLMRLKGLPPETTVICGHGVPTTISRELLV